MTDFSLIQYQAGTESTFATGVTPTVKLMDVVSGSLDANVQTEVPKVQDGSYGPSDEGVLLFHEGGANLEQLATYEDVCYWLDNQLGQATPSGAGPYVRAYSMPAGTAITPRVLTLYKGASGSGNSARLTGGLIQSSTIAGQSDGYTKISGPWLGAAVQPGQTLQSLSNRTVNKIMRRHWALYVDAWGGTMGTTAITNAMFNFELQLLTPRMGLGYGAVSAVEYSTDDYDAKLKLRVRFKANTSAWLTDIFSASGVFERQVRLVATDSTRICQLNFAGINEGASKLWESEKGVMTFEVAMMARYNSALGNSFTASVTNGVSALA